MRTMVRLREAIIAIPSLPQSLMIVTVPHDAVLEVVGEPQKSGLVEALWEGRPVAVFIRDIESRGELIGVAKTGTEK
jgi:hypothetical protein